MLSAIMYYFVDWERTPDGLRAALPEDVGCSLLAEPDPSAGYALLEVDPPPDNLVSHQVTAVPDVLADLLDAAKQYPPALALARNQVRQSVCSRAEFAALLTERLRYNLRIQPTSPFCLCLARRSELGYRNAGTYYWIVGYRPDRPGREVCWVSRDYFVYQDALADFEVDKAWLAARFSTQ